MKIGKKERAPKNEREQGERGKMSKGAGSIDPPNRASILRSNIEVKVVKRSERSDKFDCQKLMSDL